jgi:hypothetical protein
MLDPLHIPMRGHLVNTLDSGPLHRRVRIEALGNRPGYDGLPFFLQLFDQTFLLLHQSIDLSRLAVEEASDG